jgi:hypothetical protein
LLSLYVFQGKGKRFRMTPETPVRLGIFVGANHDMLDAESRPYLKAMVKVIR